MSGLFQIPKWISGKNGFQGGGQNLLTMTGFLQLMCKLFSLPLCPQFFNISSMKVTDLPSSFFFIVTFKNGFKHQISASECRFQNPM